MATLSGRHPKDTYKDLLQVSNANAGVDATLRTVEDGEGTSSALQLSTTGAKIVGALEVTGALTGTVTATGSTTSRTLANRFADVFDVKGFGATGDGVTNDTANIQLAINAAGTAGGGIVFFPPGTYLVDRVTDGTGNFDLDVCLDIQANDIHLRGSGRGVTIIKKAQNTARAHIIKIGRRVGTPIIVNDCSVRDLTIQGNRTTASAETSRHNSGIDVSNGCARVVLENLHIYDTIYYGIGFQQESFIDCRVSHCTIHDTGADGLDWKSNTMLTSYGNLIEHVTVLRFGLDRAAIGVAQAGINPRPGIVVRDCYVGEYTGDNAGLRVDDSLDAHGTVPLARTHISNVTCIGDGTTGTKGLQVSPEHAKIEGIHCASNEYNYWLTDEDCQYSNLSSRGGTHGVYLYGGGSNAPNRATFTNVNVAGAATSGVTFNGAIDGVVFVNLVTDGSAIVVGASVTNARFIGGVIPSGYTDSGTGTQLIGVSGQVGPLTAGRSTTQNLTLTGDGSANYLTGVSASGVAKRFEVFADTNSGEFRAGTKAASDAVLYANNVAGFKVDTNSHNLLGLASPATSATTGFAYLPTMAGTPSGAPTTYTGRSPMVVDSTGSKLWVRVSGVWKSTTLA